MSDHSSHNGPGHETGDVTFNRAIWLIPLCMVLLVAYVAVCWLGATSSLTCEMARKQAAGAKAEAASWNAFRAQEDSSLHGYTMKDPENGVVQIPIERAMEMMVKESRPSADSPKADTL